VGWEEFAGVRIDAEDAAAEFCGQGRGAVYVSAEEDVRVESELGMHDCDGEGSKSRRSR